MRGMRILPVISDFYAFKVENRFMVLKAPVRDSRVRPLAEVVTTPRAMRRESGAGAANFGA